MTFENGYNVLRFHCLEDYLDDLIELMLKETDPKIRGRFVELVGDSKNPKAIPYLEKELRHPDGEVRSWAYGRLQFFEHPDAERIAAEFRRSNPHEEFLQ